LTAEIERLSKHILAAANGAEGSNSLWRHFGISIAARATSVPSSDEKLEYILELLRTFRPETAPIDMSTLRRNADADVNAFVDLARTMATEVRAKFETVRVSGTEVELDLGDYFLTDEIEKSILAAAPNFGLSARIVGERYREFLRRKTAE
jgi:hypothetical protein